MDTTNFKPGRNDVSFESYGETLKGHLFLPDSFDSESTYPIVIVTGSWLTVKEQMAGLYAQKLAEWGYPALTFDFRHFGESGGQPRQFESPERKIEDIRSAVDFVQTLPFNNDRIASFGVCASAGYQAHAAAQDERITSLILVAPWLHNAELVKPLYGGEEGVHQRTYAGEAARQAYEEKNHVYVVPACNPVDEQSAMPMEADYYLNPDRGAVQPWRNEFAVMSWPGWLGFDAVKAADDIDIPVLMVHSEDAAVPEGAHRFFDALKANKDIHWIGGTQFDFYDQEPNVSTALEHAVKQLEQTLQRVEA